MTQDRYLGRRLTDRLTAEVLERLFASSARRGFTWLSSPASSLDHGLTSSPPGLGRTLRAVELVRGACRGRARVGAERARCCARRGFGSRLSCGWICYGCRKR